MNKLLGVSTLALALSVSQGHANLFNVDGTWATPIQGYATHIEPDDQSGSILGETIEFSSVALFPHPLSVSVDTPNFGEITLNYTSITNFFNNDAGIFYSMAGTDSAGGLDRMTAVIAPSHGILRFEVEGWGFNNLTPTPPPPIITPPPCADCGSPPPITGIPETSTWLMMLTGFALLSIPALSKRRHMKARISTGL